MPIHWGGVSSSRHAWYRAVPRANRIPAPSSRAYQQKPTRVEGADIVMQSSTPLASFMLEARSSRELNLWQNCHEVTKKSSKIVPLGAPLSM